MPILAHIVPEFTANAAIAAVLTALAFISIMSLIKEPYRKQLNAVILAGAGAVYWNGGLGIAEYLFSVVMLFAAFKGLKQYAFIGIGWLLHTGWDIIHHLCADPIIALAPSSSAGCAVCDPIIALWFFMGAPTIWNLFNKYKTPTVS